MSSEPLPANLAVFTTKGILAGKDVIVLVSHDEEDGAWQFMPDKEVALDESALVALAEIVALDASVLGVLDLPPGWQATRRTKTAAWERKPEDRSR